MKLTVLGVVLICVAGCHVTTGSDHTLVSDAPEDVPAGRCVILEGPFNLPSGSTNDYTVNDIDDTDSMTVSIMDDASAQNCDFNAGYGTRDFTGSLSSGTGSVPDGPYDFVVQCNNADIDCEFNLTWTANY
jgi:hypothetical protein